jgi:hypothetical protein
MGFPEARYAPSAGWALENSKTHILVRIGGRKKVDSRAMETEKWD